MQFPSHPSVLVTLGVFLGPDIAFVWKVPEHLLEVHVPLTFNARRFLRGFATLGRTAALALALLGFRPNFTG